MKFESRTILPSPDILNNLECGRFVLSNLAAKRAKQIKDGAPPLIRTASNHPLSIALAEIAAGKIRPILKSLEELEAAEAAQAQLHEVKPNELGILMPSLDDVEDELLIGVLEDDEDEDEIEEGSSLVDLLGDDVVEDEAEEPDAIEEDSNTLSLSDLAADEEVDEDSEEV